MEAQARRHGTNSRTIARRKKRESDPIGFFHIDLNEVRTAKGRVCLRHPQLTQGA